MNKTIAEDKEKQKEKKREDWLRQEKKKEEDKEEEELRLYQNAVEKGKGKKHGNKIRLLHEDKLRLEKKEGEAKKIEEEKAMMMWQERQAFCYELLQDLREDQAEYERMEAEVFAKRSPELWCNFVLLVLHKYYDSFHCLIWVCTAEPFSKFWYGSGDFKLQRSHTDQPFSKTKCLIRLSRLYIPSIHGSVIMKNS
jgi:hypothetical protein